MSNENKLHDQLVRYLDGSCTGEEARTISERLETDPSAVELFAEILLQGSAIRDFTQTHPAPQIASVPKFLSWLAWRPPAAAAAGLVFGMLCTSMVFAYVRPTWESTITLLNESFESDEAPKVTGVPSAPDYWSGDFTKIVGEEQDVKPGNGTKMLRLLQGGFEGKTSHGGRHVADLYHLVDLRPHRQDIADGSARAQLSAAFNTHRSPGGEIYSCRMSIHAFSAEMVNSGSVRRVGQWDESCLASASTGGARLDRDPASWQTRHNELWLPANTDFVMIHLVISAVRKNLPETGFAGHYIDDVHLTLRHREER